MAKLQNTLRPKSCSTTSLRCSTRCAKEPGSYLAKAAEFRCTNTHCNHNARQSGRVHAESRRNELDNANATLRKCRMVIRTTGYHQPHVAELKVRRDQMMSGPSGVLSVYTRRKTVANETRNAFVQ